MARTEGGGVMKIYIAKKSCGCIIAAHVDRPEYRETVAKQMGEWVINGFTVEHVDEEYVRINLKGCHHNEQASLFVWNNKTPV